MKIIRNIFLEATAEEWVTVAGATRSGIRAAKEVVKIL